MAATKEEKAIQAGSSKLLAKTVLANPEPYHTPGYCGFCPQFKFQIGETFGRTTTRLLSDPSVPKSNRTLLADIKPVKPGYPDRDIAAGREYLIRSRKASFGDQKFTEQMVPGYTGYIPKSQHYYGNRYAEICRDAVATFEKDQQGERKKKETTKAIQRVQGGHMDVSKLPAGTSCRRTSPLRKLPSNTDDRFNYTSTNKQHSISPYYMSDTNPQKFFMSGYTGFVPNARGQTGVGYPILTNRALIKFTSDPSHPMVTPAKAGPVSSSGTKPRAGALQPLKRLTSDEIRRLCGRRLPVIYPIDSGLVPHYTGHIPGQKFRYGTTFGHSTKNAKRDPKTSTKQPICRST